jgi:hypothetical protein
MFDRLDRDSSGKVTRKILYVGSQPIDSIPLEINDKASIPLTNNDVAEPRRGKSTPLQSIDSLQSKDLYKGLSLKACPKDWREPITEYIDHRKLIKKPLTQRALSRFINKVQKCVDSGISADSAIATTIDRGWSDINPEWIKNTNNQGKPNEHYF